MGNLTLIFRLAEIFQRISLLMSSCDRTEFSGHLATNCATRISEIIINIRLSVSADLIRIREIAYAPAPSTRL